MNRARALLVGDDPVFLQACARLLQEGGLDCEAAGSAAEAMGRLEAQRFDLLVCDLEPKLEQLALGTLERAERPEVLIFTEQTTPDERLKLAREHALTVLHKPLDPAQLSRTVAWLLEGRYFSRLEAPKHHFEALYRMAMLANSERSLTAFLDQLVSTCVTTLGGDSGTLLLASGAGAATLSVASIWGRALDGPARSVPVADSVSGWVAREQRPLRLVGDVSHYPQFARLDSNPKVRESMVVPIVQGSLTLGVLCVGSRSEGVLGPEKLALLLGAADIASSVIHRHRLGMNQETQNRLAVLGQVSAGVAHELNNPLASVKLNLAMLQRDLETRGVVDEGLSALLADLREGTSRMSAIVGQIKDAASKPRPSMRPVDIGAVLAQSLQLTEPQFKSRVRLQLEPAREQLLVFGNAGRLSQVVTNLLVNACQAVEAGGRVTLKSRGEGAHVVVEVEDDGPSISPEVASHLFEPFFTTKPEGEGTGLGLSVARQIAVEHGGEVSFTRLPGRGACFRLRLPHAAVELPAQPQRVLVVDDEPALLRAMERVLSPTFQVACSTSAEQARALLEREGVELVLTDQALPGDSGVALVEWLRARGYRGPAVVVTATPDAAEVRRALEQGTVQHVIPKPWSPTALLSESTRLLAGAKAAPAAR